MTAATPRRVYSDAHAYHINSISINSDEETFISADDLRINLWNFQYRLQSFSAFEENWCRVVQLIHVMGCARISCGMQHGHSPLLHSLLRNRVPFHAVRVKFGGWFLKRALQKDSRVECVVFRLSVEQCAPVGAETTFVEIS